MTDPMAGILGATSEAILESNITNGLAGSLRRATPNAIYPIWRRVARTLSKVTPQGFFQVLVVVEPS